MEAASGAKHPSFRFFWLLGGEPLVEVLGVTPIKVAAEAKQVLVLGVEQVKEHAPSGKPDKL